MLDMRMAMVRGAVKATKHLYAGEYNDLYHGGMSITEEQWDTLTSNRPWAGVHRPVARQGLNNLMTGVLVEAGLPEIRVPAEFMAVVIAVAVHPVNWMQAAFIGQAAYDGAEALESDGHVGLEREPVSTSRMFALVMYASQDSMVQTLNMHPIEEEEKENG